MRLLLISNSTNFGEPFLQYPLPYIKDFLGDKPLRAVFIPYAAVSLTYDEFEAKVSEKFSAIGHNISGIHKEADAKEAIRKAEAIVIGGGNTFHLLYNIYKNGLLEIIREKALSGTPFVGWSAGANVACPTICTTNDMPIIQPESFKALNLVPFQINPHYIDINPDGHAGETREARILEFIEVNRNVTVAGLREGCILRIENNDITYIGKRSLRLFRWGRDASELNEESDFRVLFGQ